MAKRKQLGTIVGSGGTTVVFEDNSAEILAGLKNVSTMWLTAVGMKVERYAKKLCPVGTPKSTGKKGYKGGTLRNSITFNVDDLQKEVSIGSNVEYAPYVELGTGPFFTPPPEWEQFDTEKGTGKSHGYVKARPYLRPAVEDHRKDFKNLLERMLKG